MGYDRTQQIGPVRASMTKKNLVFWGALLALIAPYLYNIAQYAHIRNGLLAESSIYSLDRHKYFWDLLRHGSMFFAGQHSIFLATYFSFYALWSSLGTVFSDITSYFLLLIAFAALGYRYLVRLFILLGGESDPEQTDIRRWTVACSLALLYFSSLSSFNYLKSNALFALPFMVLPPLLYWALDYLNTGDKRRLILLLLLSPLLADFNLTHTFIIIAFINVFLLITRLQYRAHIKNFVVRLAAVNAVLAPACCFLLLLVFENALYAGTISKFAADITENMYSNNASYLNIFIQLTDWGIFGSWRGVPYYDFSAFYSRPQIWVFGLLPYLLLAFAFASTGANQLQRRLASSFLILCIVIFQIMLGNNNAVYRFFYDHVIIFQVFRNITKLAPALYLALFFAIYVLLQARLKARSYLVVVMVLVASSLVYNIPYWSYGGVFFANRTVGHIPAYWDDVANYFANRADPNSRILALPAIYINDIYHWRGRTVAVQGSLLDDLLKNQSYRLSECCIGSLQFQRDARSVFIPSTRSTRRLDVDYTRLSSLTRRYHLDYVLVSADLVSEYQDLNDIYRWLGRAGYTPQGSFGPVSIYRKAANFALPVSGRDVAFQQINPLRYRVYLQHLKGARTVSLSSAYNKGWAAFVDNDPTDRWCHAITNGPHNAVQCDGGSEGPLDEIGAAFRTSPLASAHAASAVGGNQWVLSAQYIEQHFPPQDYIKNPDGSIDVQLELYFKPQSYFFLTSLLCMIAFGIIFCALLPALIVSYRGRISYAVAAGIAIWALAATVVLVDAFVYSPGPLPEQTAHASGAVILPAGTSVKFNGPNQPPQTREFSLASQGNARMNRIRWSVAGCSKTVRLAWVENSKAALRLTLQPLSIGSCMLRITATSGGEFRAKEDIPIVVSGPLSWVTNGKEVEHLSIVLPSENAPAQSLELIRLNAARGLWPQITNSQCDRIAHLVPEVGAPLQTALNQSEASVVLIAKSPGVCTARFRDRYAPPSATPVTLHIRIMGALLFASNTQSSTVNVKFANMTRAPKQIGVYKQFDPEFIKLAFGTNGCMAVAGFKIGKELAAYGNRAAASSPIIVWPAAPGRCTSTFVDRLGSVVTIHVHVGSGLPLWRDDQRQRRR